MSIENRVQFDLILKRELVTLVMNDKANGK